jgi:putative ATPase
MDLFEKKDNNKEKSDQSIHEPLATRMRPGSLEEFVGQDHILGDNKLLRRMITSGIIGSVIFYGPPSSGKTTLAFVISQEVNAVFVTLNAVLDGVKDLKKVVEKARDLRKMNEKKTILFVDEIHRWNKAQQDALLPHLESGLLTLIGATTENPFYSLVGPLLSRCQLFELYPFNSDQISIMIEQALRDEERGLGKFNVIIDKDARKFLSEYAGGDIRNALNALELAVATSKEDKEGKRYITLELAKECFQQRTIKYDRSGDEHYHYASAFIKSMRGSDPDAALYWLSAMLESGEDPNFIFRRMLIFSSEDIGMADSSVLTLVNTAHEAFTKCGMPEGWYFLSHACIYCALAPKSNSTSAVFSVSGEIRKNGIGIVPAHLRDKTANKLEARYLDKDNASEDYKYPHSFPKHWIEQQYLPDKLKDKKWYEAGKEGYEARYYQRLQSIKKGD